MKKIITLVIVLALALSPVALANTGMWNQEFERRNFFDDFTMLVPSDWEYDEGSSDEDQEFFFGASPHKVSNGLLMVSWSDVSGHEKETVDDLIKMYARGLVDWGAGGYYYRDFYSDGTYCWFWSGDFSLQRGGRAYSACGFCGCRNERFYFVLFINPNSNGLNMSWRLNTMIDSIEWNDAA